MRIALLSVLLLPACKGGDLEVDDSQSPADDSSSQTDDSDSPVDSPAELDGEALFLDTCSSCHGADARGTRKGPDLSREMGLSDSQIINIILNGKEKMPAQDVTEEEAQAIVDYLRSILQ